MSFQVPTAERATRVVSVSLGLSELLPMETGVSGRATAVTLSIYLFTAQTAGGASEETPGVIECVCDSVFA